MLGDQPQRSLHANMRWVWIVFGLFTSVVMTGVTIGVILLVATVTEGDPRWWPAVLVAVGGIVFSVAWSLLAWRRWRWDVTELALTLHRGVITHHAVALPFFRIQHIDTNRGPLDQLLGMTSFDVHTASVSARLPGIAADEAVELRRELLELAARAAAEVGGEGSIDAV